jgi:hypothetical protein
LRHLYLTSSYGQFQHIRQTFEAVEPEILILGSSRAAHHYVSRLIQQETGLSCFNAGLDGTEINYHAAAYYANVARYRPKLVVIDINEYRFTLEGTGEKSLRNVIPYMKQVPEVAQLYYDSDDWGYVKLLSAIYPHNSEILQLLTGARSTDDRELGYDPIKGKMPEDAKPFVEDKLASATPDQKALKQLADVLQHAQARQIPILLVQSPRFAISPSNPVVERIGSLANQFGAQFINDINLSGVFDRPAWFKDTAHLNHDGAVVFSQHFATQARKSLNN